MEATVRELLAAAQAERKATLDAGRVDTEFKVGDRVLLRTKELLDAADIGKLRPRWDGPFTVTACPSPNAYTLALPRKMRCSPTVNVDRLKPRRVAAAGGALTGEGGGVRRHRPPPRHRAAARARGWTGDSSRGHPGAAGGTGGVSARCPDRGSDRRCPHRAGGALPLAD